MIKQLKMGFKLLGYSHGILSCVAGAIIMVVFGVATEWTALSVPGTDFNASQNLGGYFILVAAIWPLQMLISLNVPNVVAASPWKKRVQTSVFSLIGGVCFLVSYVLVVVLKLVKYSQGLLDYTNLILELLGFPMLIVLLMVYMSFSLKYFVVSTIVFCVVCPAIMFMHGIAYYFGWFSVEGITPLMAVVVGILSILLSMAISYGILSLLYRRPISKYSQMNSLQKRM